MKRWLPYRRSQTGWAFQRELCPKHWTVRPILAKLYKNRRWNCGGNGLSQAAPSRRAPETVCPHRKYGIYRASSFRPRTDPGFRQMAEPAGYTVDIVPATDALQASVSYDAFMLQHDYLGAFILGFSLSDPGWTFPTSRTRLCSTITMFLPIPVWLR